MSAAIIVTGVLAVCGAVLLFASGVMSAGGKEHPAWFVLLSAYAGLVFLFMAIAGAWGAGA